MLNDIRDLIYPLLHTLRAVSGELAISVLIVAALVASLRLVSAVSRAHGQRALGQLGGDVSQSGVIRIRRQDTRARVIVACSRAALVALAALALLHVLAPRSAPALAGTALIAALAAFALQQVVRDAAAGSVMMVERWFHVGDQVMVLPHGVRGVVEHFNLRSTWLRTLDGELAILHNSSIWSVSLAPRGVREMTLELIVRDLDKGRQLIERASEMLPNGPAQVVRPLRISVSEPLGQQLHRIVARAAVAPGREWLLEDFAVKLLPEIDSQMGGETVILHGPIVYNADRLTEASMRRSVVLAGD